MSLRKNLLKNGIASTLQKSVRILEQLLLVPFFITVWGAEYYGEWLTLTIIPTMLAFSDLGFGTAAANSFVLKYASGDRANAANIARSGFRIINFVVLASIGLSVLILFVLDYFKIFDKSLVNRVDAIWAVSLLMTARILNFYSQLFEAYYKAARKAALGINLQTVYGLVNLGAGLLVLLQSGNVIHYALSTFTVTSVFVPIYGWIARKTLSLHKEFKGIVKKEEIKSITGKGLGYLMNPAWQAILFQGTTFVVRITLGPTAVAVFNTVRTVTRMINQAYTLVISTILPELQFELGARNYAKAQKIFRLALISVFGIAVAGSIFLFIGGEWFYQIWTREALNPPQLMWNIFISSIIFNALWWISSFVFIALNKPYEFGFAGLTGAVIAVVSSYFFSKLWGLSGAALGSVIMDFLLFIYIVPRSFKMIGLNGNTILKESLNDLTEMKQTVVKRR